MPSRERILSLGLKDSERQEVPGWLRASRAFGHGAVRRMTRQREDGGVSVPRDPPHCPAGWHTGPPDFIGVGGQRCGTTRWFDLISSHPEVIPPTTTKEIHFFDRFYVDEPTASDVAGYHAYFPRDHRKVGEWTPCYMSSPWAPSLLAQAAPDARLLILLRDPVDRYASGLQHDSTLAREQGEPLSQLAPFEAFMRGLYHAQISNVLCHYDRPQLLVLQYERCTREPLEQLRRTFGFLGLSDTEFVPDDVHRHPHLQPTKPALSARTTAAYAAAYEDDVSRLAERFPEIDLELWPNFAHLASESAVAR